MKVMTAEAGCRISCDGNLATILYRGEVPPTKGEWLGVEWDDPSRGKHDGIHEGIRYFQTKHPTSGSFLRPKKAEFGYSFITAVRERYGLIEDDNAGVDVKEMFVLGKNQHTTVEVVGAQSVNLKQSKLDRLLDLGLRGYLVSDVGSTQEIRQTVPNVGELDLSQNLLNSWEKIAQIAEQLDHLKSLNLSENKLRFPTDYTELIKAFKSIRVLYVNKMNYSWSEILQCCDMVTELEQIHACFNNITSIPHTGAHLNNIRLVNLESNPLQGWSQVLMLRTLPNIETLILNDTGLENIELSDVPPGQKSHFFPKLQLLSISGNRISEWSSITELSKLQYLTELTFRKNPLLSQYDDNTVPRTIVIGKIASLKLFNRTVVSAVERRGAEIDYLKLFGKLWRKSGGHQDPKQNKPNATFTEEHPVYQTLVDKFGPPEDSELIQQSTALTNFLVSVWIDSPNMPDKPPIKKKLPVSMTVQKLKMMVQRLFRADIITMKASYSSEKVEGLVIEMDSDQKEIGYYSIEEGDTIHITWS